ncbi:MAG TPA: zf-HC2 domain-containing protein [Armatimonadota bacterium]|nr:zf-HC2 domain-containing protein [Armatimonadota bacterium]
MTCSETRKLLSPFMDGELPAADVERAAAHLQTCAACREQLAALRFTSRLTASLPAARVRGDLASYVVARAAAVSWGERWAAVRDVAAPAGRFFAQEFGRAAAIVALFALAAGRGHVVEAAILDWPVRVAGAASTGTAYLSAGLDRVQEVLDRAVAESSRREPKRPRVRDGRSEPARPSSIPSNTAVVCSRQEGAGNVIA